MPMAGVRKIAVLRANGIGDFVFALPALESLRCAYPESEITLLGAEWHRDFLAGRPGPIDRVVVVPRVPGVRGTPDDSDDDATVSAFFEEMRAEQFDLAVQLHGGGRNSNPLILRLGARLTVGMQTPDAPPLDRSLPYCYWQPEVSRYLEVVRLAAARPVAIEPSIAVTQRDLDESMEVVPSDERKIVVLHPGASDPRRRWPASKFGYVASRIAQLGARVMIVGGDSEIDLAEAVVASSNVPVQSLAGSLTLQQLTGLLARSALVIGNDSGPVHLAEALGTPTVGIYWCGNVVNGGPMMREWHRVAISWRLHCPACGTHTISDTCQHQQSFVADVPVEDVLAPAFELLDRSAAARPRSVCR
ncbi:MAG TPA: glycosyltransferase family 9 protein [Dehalococcoidia bacterium]|nr:glycosyltransferase family 9 protein [Dehalococcoidia bacterium]